jgi:hypothetical protein
MVQVSYLDECAKCVRTGLTLAETRELEALERRKPSLAEWDAYTMQPISEHERRWAHLSQKYIEAVDQIQKHASGPRGRDLAADQNRTGGRGA